VSESAPRSTVVEVQRDLRDHAVAHPGLRLHQGDVVGVDRVLRTQHELRADGVDRPHAPRGAQVAVERVQRTVLRQRGGGVRRSSVLLDDGAVGVGRAREHVERHGAGGGVGVGLAGTQCGAGGVLDRLEEVLGPPPVRVGEHEVRTVAQRLPELGRLEGGELEHELVAVEQPRGGGVDDALAVTREDHRTRLRRRVHDGHRALHVEQRDRRRVRHVRGDGRGGLVAGGHDRIGHVRDRLAEPLR
jgi:hypothetical protein